MHNKPTEVNLNFSMDITFTITDMRNFEKVSSSNNVQKWTILLNDYLPVAVDSLNI